MLDRRRPDSATGFLVALLLGMTESFNNCRLNVLEMSRPAEAHREQ
jgi:hypothetical protein